jgi:hypothetical protein
MLGSAPETLDAVDVVSTFGLFLVFFDYNMLTPDSQGSIGMPIVSVV